jgi:hypothetical protein
MLTKANFSAERFIAQFTGERSFAVMGSSCMHLQSVRCWKHLLTFDAGEYITQIAIVASASHEEVMVMIVQRGVGGTCQQMLTEAKQLFGCRGGIGGHVGVKERVVRVVAWEQRRLKWFKLISWSNQRIFGQLMLISKAGHSLIGRPVQAYLSVLPDSEWPA